MFKQFYVAIFPFFILIEKKKSSKNPLNSNMIIKKTSFVSLRIFINASHQTGFDTSSYL